MVSDRAQERNGCVLEVRDLRVSYHTAAGPVRAVNGVSFFLRPGERFGLVGEFDGRLLRAREVRKFEALATAPSLLSRKCSRPPRCR